MFTWTMPHIERVNQPGLCIVTLCRDSCEECYATVTPLGNESVEAMFRRVAHAVRERKAVPVSQEVFHMGAHRDAALGCMCEAFGEIRWPITWIEDGNGMPPLAGACVHAVSGGQVQPIYRHDCVVGSLYEDYLAHYVVLGDLRDNEVCNSHVDQARLVFEDMTIL